MRGLAISLAAFALVSGCQTASAPPEGPVGGVSGWELAATEGPAASPTARQTRWEREWELSKERVARARDTAVAAGETVPPDVDREVTELLDRQIEGDAGSEARIKDLQDAVSDALRLAEILSI